MPQASNVVQFPGWAKGLFRPHRYKVLYGGRGSGKSYAVADALLLAGYAKPCRILCAREFQNSLSESVLYLLAERIDALGIDDSVFVSQVQIGAVRKGGAVRVTLLPFREVACVD